jgi:CheY-like chemotaxis protein
MLREDFARFVKEALDNLYDPPYLQTHPLADILVTDREAGESRGETVRRLLREAAELLKPDSNVPSGRPEWLGYRIVWLHYMRSLSREDTCKELGISESTFFRYRRQALAALTDLLWEQGLGSPVGSSTHHGSLEIAVAADDIERSLALASMNESRCLELGQILNDARRTMEPLAEQQGITLRLQVPAELPPVYGHVAALRHSLLSVLVEAIKRASDKVLTIEARLQEGEVLWKVGHLAADRESEINAGLALSRKLLQYCHGRLWLHEDGYGWTICVALSLPCPHPILVIDDDPKALELYRRYLRADEYTLVGARSLQQASELLRDMQPDLVIMDVIMPGRDGWTLLRQLKSDQATARIPVLVCSVVAQPELATALGAERVLNKPFTREELVQATRECLRPAGSPARQP